MQADTAEGPGWHLRCEVVEDAHGDPLGALKLEIP